MNRRELLKTMLLAAAGSATVSMPELFSQAQKTAPVEIAAGRGLICECDSFVDWMQNQRANPQVLVVGRPKSGKTTVIEMLRRHLYPSALVSSRMDSACFPRAGFAAFIEANVSRQAVLDAAYGGDVLRYVAAGNWKNVCSADIVLLTFTSPVALADASPSAGFKCFYVVVHKNRDPDHGRMWRIG